MQYLFARLNLIIIMYIDQGFWRSKELEVLDLSANSLNCSIITSLHGFISLRSLILSDNKFNCSLSTLGTHLPFLYYDKSFYFHFFKRSIYYVLATDFSKFSRLELLDLGGNQFTGSLHVEGTFIIIVVSTITKKH